MAVSYAPQQLKAYDSLCFLTTAFAPKRHRLALSTLYCFHYELTRIQDQTTDTMSGLIRLQWWRDTIEQLYEGKTRDHPLLTDLATLLDQHSIEKDVFIALIDAHDRDIDFSPFKDISELESYCQATTSALFAQIANILGESSPESQQCIHHLGIAVGLVALLRRTPTALKKHKLFFPESFAQEQNTTVTTLIENPEIDILVAMTQALTPVIHAHLRQTTCKSLKPLSTQKEITSAYLKRLEKHNHDLFRHDIEQFRHLMPLKLLAYKIFAK